MAAEIGPAAGARRSPDSGPCCSTQPGSAQGKADCAVAVTTFKAAASSAEGIQLSRLLSSGRHRGAAGRAPPGGPGGLGLAVSPAQRAVPPEQERAPWSRLRLRSRPTVTASTGGERGDGPVAGGLSDRPAGLRSLPPRRAQQQLVNSGGAMAGLGQPWPHSRPPAPRAPRSWGRASEDDVGDSSATMLEMNNRLCSKKKRRMPLQWQPVHPCYLA